MLSRSFRTEESRARYWAQQAVELCSDIEDDTLNEQVEAVMTADRALDRDRRIMVIGGDKCGKSTLLAAIAEYPLIAKVSLTEDYVCWRYRCKDGDATCSRFIPLENLSGLELVDTKSCADEAVASTVGRLAKGADVVIAVVDGRSYEASPVWAQMAALKDTQRASSLIAVTHTESLGAEAALKLKDTLREFCREQVGGPLPICFVNPNTSRENMESFLTLVTDALAQPGGVRSAIRHLLECAKELTRKQGSILVARERVARTDSGFLAGIEQEIDYFLDRQRDSLESCTEAYAEAAMRALPSTINKLQKTLGWFLSPVTLLRLELMGAGTERFYYRALRSEVLFQQETSDGNFVLSCMSHWRSVRPRMKKTLECEIGEFPDEVLRADLEELRVRMGRELYKPFADIKLRNSFNKTFNAHVGWMSACCIFICLFFILAGILGIFGLQFFAILSVIFAGLVWVLGSIIHYVVARRLCSEIVQYSLELQDKIKASIGSAVERLLVSRVAAYRRLYTEPREKVARHEASLGPLQHKHKDINMQLNAAAPRM